MVWLLRPTIGSKWSVKPIWLKGATTLNLTTAIVMAILLKPMSVWPAVKEKVAQILPKLP